MPVKPGFKWQVGYVRPAKWEARAKAICFLAFLGFIGFALYRGLDDDGWVTHSETVPVIFESEHGDPWLASEFRNCTSYKQNSLPIECGTGERREEHILPVLFHGRIDRVDHDWFTWRCQRENFEKGIQDDAITCWALD